MKILGPLLFILSALLYISVYGPLGINQLLVLMLVTTLAYIGGNVNAAGWTK